MLLPHLVALDLDAIVKSLKLPGTRMIPASHAVGMTGRAVVGFVIHGKRRRGADKSCGQNLTFRPAVGDWLKHGFTTW